jgi:hypothetical protein
MVVSPIRYMVIEVGGLPRFFGEIVRTLWREPSDRLQSLLSDETQLVFGKRVTPIQIPFIIFREIMKYSSQRVAKRGRVKRKIWRRLQRQSGVSD